tara:strand:+ start:150 stop:380 length:231 start_codon:yes stop_codon:yes gene_type:complete
MEEIYERLAVIEDRMDEIIVEVEGIAEGPKHYDSQTGYTHLLAEGADDYLVELENELNELEAESMALHKELDSNES